MSFLKPLLVSTSTLAPSLNRENKGPDWDEVDKDFEGTVVFEKGLRIVFTEPGLGH